MEEPEQAASVAPCVPVCVYSGECLSACGRPTQRVRRCCQAGKRCGCVRQERSATCMCFRRCACAFVAAATAAAAALGMMHMCAAALHGVLEGQRIE